MTDYPALVDELQAVHRELLGLTAAVAGHRDQEALERLHDIQDQLEDVETALGGGQA